MNNKEIATRILNRFQDEALRAWLDEAEKQALLRIIEEEFEKEHGDDHR